LADPAGLASRQNRKRFLLLFFKKEDLPYSAPTAICRTATSASSESAAIHPDISTIGIPGPGCAAPPAKYSPGKSRDLFPGLNAPNSRPWLASP
jgi:hypothetical protein